MTASGPPATAAEAAAPDVFISYAREDRECAQALAAALQAAGMSVWWDRELAGGQDFGNVIAERLDAARSVLVLWSGASVVSGFVRDESARARDAGKLLPVRIEEVALPLGFGTLHTLDLFDWHGDSSNAAFIELLANLRRGPGVSAAAVRRASLRWRKPLLLALLLAAVLGAAAFGWRSWREQQALEQFQQGLSAQFARDRNLQAARNAYLNALNIDPELGRAHYYLAHVYALLILPDDARAQFAAALQFERDLDAGQRDDARVQLAALQRRDDAAPLSRADMAERAPASTGAPVASRAPAAEPPHASAALPAPSATERVEAAALPLRQLPRLPPPPELQQALQAQVDALFAARTQERLSAATSVALQPQMLSDILPLALEQATSSLRQQPVDAAAAAGASNTLQLLLSASPATLNANHAAVQRLLDAVQPLGENQREVADRARVLLDKAEDRVRPVAYIQIADETQRRLAQTLAQRIRAAGYEVPAIEVVGARAPSRSEVRVQGTSTQGWARWLAKLVGEAAGEPARLSTLRDAHPKMDTYEIWLDKSLCVTRQTPHC